MNMRLDEEIRYRLLKILNEADKISQRDMARQAGVSLGKVNYCLGELATQGFIKVHRFKSAKNKVPYIYALTPKGLGEQARLTLRFLKKKVGEYEEIKSQIRQLASEVPQERLQELVPPEALARTTKTP